jgi:hypothetical protein
MKPPRTLKEMLLALALIAFGLLCLPALIYVVGQLIIGEYEAGFAGFYQAIGTALAAGNRYAWMLILSPYLVVTLIRLWLWLRRQRRSV